MHSAVENGSEAIVTLLLSYGADVNFTDKVGLINFNIFLIYFCERQYSRTPLHYCKKASVHAIDLLLSKGTNADLQDIVIQYQFMVFINLKH